MGKATVLEGIVGNPKPANYVANSPVQIDLSREAGVFEFLRLRLAGTLTLASYSTAPTKLVEAVENLIAAFNLQCTGKGGNAVSDTVKSVDAAWLRFQTRILEGTDVDRTDIGTTNAAFAFATAVKCYLADPRSDYAGASMLDNATLSTLLATIQFRDQTAMVTGGVGGTAVLSAVTATLHARRYIGLPPIRRPFLKESQMTFDVAASQVGKQLQNLPVGNRIRRMCFKGTVGANNFSDPSDVLLGNNTTKAEGAHVTLEQNSGYRPVDQIYQAMRSDNKELFGVESVPSGYAVWEPSRNGRVAGTANMRNAQSLTGIIDPSFTGSNTNTVQVTTVEIVAK